MKDIRNAKVPAHLYYLVLAYIDESNIERARPLYQCDYNDFKRLVDDAVKYFISKCEQI